MAPFNCVQQSQIIFYVPYYVYNDIYFKINAITDMY